MSLQPPSIRRTRGSGFADYTITQRFPQIAAQVKEVVQSEVMREKIDVLVCAIENGENLTHFDFTKPSNFWRDYLEGIKNQTWDDISFFELEFLFYHGLNSVTGFFDLGFDVFEHIRQTALNNDIIDFECEVKTIVLSSVEETIKYFVLRSTFGNSADYSQLHIVEDTKSNESSLLVDESDELVKKLTETEQTLNCVDFIADNAGRELCWDLALIDSILQTDVQRVVIHVKSCPMFVSDAMTSDVRNTIYLMSSQTVGSAAYLIGIRLAQYIDSGRLDIQAEDDWGEPRHFSQLSTDLATRLGNADLVIAKGDLNYRRFIEDRMWQNESSVTQAAYNVPFSAFALRVLKSEAVAGIPISVHQDLNLRDPDWRCNGKYAMVQKIGGQF
jgi:Damage-control phosphatase ARMT1-like domain